MEVLTAIPVNPFAEWCIQTYDLIKQDKQTPPALPIMKVYFNSGYKPEEVAHIVREVKHIGAKL